MLKKFLFFSTSAFAIFFLFLVQFSAVSCTKDVVTIDTIATTQTDTVIVIQHDTTVEKDTLITPAILTANPWKPQYLRAIYGGSYIYYNRGGLFNTQNFDNESIKFNADGTGIYIDNNGGQTTLTWNFTDTSYTKITWTWNLQQPIVVNWENIVYNNASISYTEYYTQFGAQVLTSGIRIPK